MFIKVKINQIIYYLPN